MLLGLTSRGTSVFIKPLNVIKRGGFSVLHFPTVLFLNVCETFFSNFNVLHLDSLLSIGSSDEGMSSLGSPSDPSLSPLAWSVTGKYLACAMEKMVNIWQVNGEYKPPLTIRNKSVWGLPAVQLYFPDTPLALKDPQTTSVNIHQRLMYSMCVLQVSS